MGKCGAHLALVSVYLTALAGATLKPFSTSFFLDKKKPVVCSASAFHDHHRH
ncbi:hypothetical protein DL89DRAFT_265559 [Linderina pennispora]|uniref:Uncharacterized protein n=1 Tax=Linderina pennispora TaxID=61395 RepID=A0A1Y1WF33_9FUNG|nr:uncharacterized protein DL89DRAFT_265559 [Linderina pennispora]ORX71846.1 hypothetical protein DL89DRAFT_265559 [Linderina pennispora]